LKDEEKTNHIKDKYIEASQGQGMDGDDDKDDDDVRGR
jgi:hypothetical protein